MAKKTSAYREAPKPCEKCLKREEELSQLATFVAGRYNFPCPACRNTDGQFHFATVCRGSRLRMHEGKWLFGKLFGWGRVVVKCPITTPHFHLYCRVCNWRWKMETDLTEKAEPSK